MMNLNLSDIAPILMVVGLVFVVIGVYQIGGITALILILGLLAVTLSLMIQGHVFTKHRRGNTPRPQLIIIESRCGACAPVHFMSVAARA